MKAVCVFCGSRTGRNPVYLEQAEKLGTEMAKRGIALIYGGANVGLMGAIANQVLESGGEVIGVMAKSLIHREISHPSLSQLIWTETLRERKERMLALADGFISLPGGTGTMDEFFEVLCLAQVGEANKPCALLNVAHYYDPLLCLFDHMEQEGFFPQEAHELVISAEDASELLDQMML